MTGRVERGRATLALYINLKAINIRN